MSDFKISTAWLLAAAAAAILALVLGMLAVSGTSWYILTPEHYSSFKSKFGPLHIDLPVVGSYSLDSIRQLCKEASEDSHTVSNEYTFSPPTLPSTASTESNFDCWRLYAAGCVTTTCSFVALLPLTIFFLAVVKLLVAPDSPVVLGLTKFRLQHLSLLVVGVYTLLTAAAWILWLIIFPPSQLKSEGAEVHTGSHFILAVIASVAAVCTGLLFIVYYRQSRREESPYVEIT